MSALDVIISVRGLPIAQGNAKAFVVGKRAVIATGVKQSTPLGAWRSSIATEARAIMGTDTTWTVPVAVTIGFRMPRPKSHFRANGLLKLDAPDWHTSKPDIDKLTRAVLDALTHVVIANDSQVGRLKVTKVYAPVGANVGADITVSDLALWR